MPLLDDLYITGLAWQLPDETDFYYAGLPFDLAQTALLAGVTPTEERAATCGWYGTRTDSARGCYAVVNRDGPLADLVGERLLIARAEGGFPSPSVAVYCHRRLPVLQDVALARRPFMALGGSWEGAADVRVEVLGGD